jgi:hypothetical protein
MMRTLTEVVDHLAAEQPDSFWVKAGAGDNEVLPRSDFSHKQGCGMEVVDPNAPDEDTKIDFYEAFFTENSNGKCAPRSIFVDPDSSDR